MRLANGHFTLGIALTAAGRHGEALQQFSDALCIFEAHRQRLWQGTTNFRIAEVHLAARRPAQAAQHSEQALALGCIGGDRMRGNVLTLLGRSLSALGQVDRAKACWQEAPQPAPAVRRAAGGRGAGTPLAADGRLNRPRGRAGGACGWGVQHSFIALGHCRSCHTVASGAGGVAGSPGSIVRLERPSGGPTGSYRTGVAHSPTPQQRTDDMSDRKTDAEITPQDNAMPTPPANDETVTTLDNAMPSGPAQGTITTMDNAMPAPPALDLDGDGK